MKYAELKASLSKVYPVYEVYGSDRYLCFDALETLKKAFAPDFPDLNIVNYPQENFDANELVKMLEVCPFADPYRVVIVDDLKVKKNQKLDLTALENYAGLESFSTVLIILNGNDGAKLLKNSQAVVCDHLLTPDLAEYIKSKLKEQNTEIENGAVSTLIEYTNQDLTRISGEMDKLAAYCGYKTVTSQMVKDLVFKDEQYQIFELTDKIARGEKQEVLKLLDAMIQKEKSLYTIIALLYNTYKRALFVAILKEKTDRELGELLGIKEFAVKMLRNQIRVFSPKKIKTIVDLVAELDSNIKQGKIKDEIGLTKTVLQILYLKNA
ncbi:MAG: DNA polymerase III subunit delta [Clostridia bacterium]|nr:DNA polymerase III subunit delta [Clostridia bacterium]